jgi:hypothetical protein
VSRKPTGDGAEPTGEGDEPTGDGGGGGTQSGPRMLHRYEAIHEHAELELELAGRGEIERLTELWTRWDELTEELPERPPAQALPLLERARLIHERTQVELCRVRDALLGEIAEGTRARRTVAGYASQVPRRAQLDRSA